MSVTETFRVVGDGRTYKEIEKGVQAYSATLTATGDATGGNLNHRFEFNPDTNSSFQPYVAVTRAAYKVGTAAQTADITWEASGGDWERYQVGNIAMAPMQLVTGHLSTEQSAAWFGFINLGRVEKGTSGRLLFSGVNVNTGVNTVLLEGFISDHPILGRWWLSA